MRIRLLIFILLFLASECATVQAQGKSRSMPGQGGQPTRAPQIHNAEGVSVEFSVEPVSSEKGASNELLAGTEARVRFKVVEATGGKAITNLRPAAWIDRREVAQTANPKECRLATDPLVDPQFGAGGRGPGDRWPRHAAHARTGACGEGRSNGSAAIGHGDGNAPRGRSFPSRPTRSGTSCRRRQGGGLRLAGEGRRGTGPHPSSHAEVEPDMGPSPLRSAISRSTEAYGPLTVRLRRLRSPARAARPPSCETPSTLWG